VSPAPGRAQGPKVETPDSEGAGSALQDAAEWRVCLEEADEATQAAFEHWLEADPRHRRAWQAIDTTWSRFSRAARPGGRAALERAFDDEHRAARRWLGAAGLTLGLMLAALPLAWLASGLGSPTHLLADHHTALGERKTLTLPDGSELVLNTATAVDIDYRADRRVIHLHDGEIQISVVPDSARPLEVLTSEGRARALGTRFTARRLERAGRAYTAVTVQESRVELCRFQSEDCLRLVRNQQARAGERGLSAVRSVDARARAAWVEGQLVVDDQPLTQVLRTLSRHHRGLFQMDETELAGLKVSGVLPLDDLDRALKALAGSQPIRVERYTPWVVRITRTP